MYGLRSLGWIGSWSGVLGHVIYILLPPPYAVSVTQFVENLEENEGPLREFSVAFYCCST